jgi:hypothetical protein
MKTKLVRTMICAIAIIMSSAAGFSARGQMLATNSVATTSPQNVVEPYQLNHSHNELGFWGGVSFKATTIFGGLHSDEAADRKFVIAAFRCGRTLAANSSVALQYTLDVIPLAIATGNIASSTTVGNVTVFNRETAPLGLQLDFANGSRVHPFLHVNGGGLIFNHSVPLPDPGKICFCRRGWNGSFACSLLIGAL